MRTPAVCVFPANASDAVKALEELKTREKIKVASGIDFFKIELFQRIREITRITLLINIFFVEQWLQIFPLLNFHCKIVLMK